MGKIKELIEKFDSELRKRMEKEGNKISKFLSLEPISKLASTNITYTDSRYGKSSAKRHGKCYEISGQFLMENSSWILVHGIIDVVLGPFAGTDYFHGWVEHKGIVYEPIRNKFYKKEDYYEVFSPKKMKKFTYTQTIKNMEKFRHWGAW